MADTDEGGRMRVLVVEDVPEILGLFGRVASRMRDDIELTTAPTGTEALRLAAQTPYDLVVADYQTDGIDGLQVLCEAHRRNPRCTRVLMTGYNELPMEVMREHAVDFDMRLQKPFRPHELQALLTSLLLSK